MYEFGIFAVAALFSCYATLAYLPAGFNTRASLAWFTLATLLAMATTQINFHGANFMPFYGLGLIAYQMICAKRMSLVYVWGGTYLSMYLTDIVAAGRMERWHGLWFTGIGGFGWLDILLISPVLMTAVANILNKVLIHRAR